MTLTRQQLRTLKRHVIDLPTDTIPDGSVVDPTTVDDFTTTTADLDAIMMAIEQFVKARRKKSTDPVPVVLYAHGGLVEKGPGLAIANAQVKWWLDNGIYPVEFVWHTGFADSLWRAVKDAVSRPREGVLENLWNTVIEGAARAGQGGAVWGNMKTRAERLSAPDGGAGFFVEKLGTWMQAHPDWITVHAVGHSAGSIFHSYLLPAALSAGVDRIDSLSLLAPAVRVDTFKAQLLDDLRAERINAPAIFTMATTVEERDNCVGAYRSSLLYLISRALEPDRDAAILGLQESIFDDDDLLAVFDGTGHKGTGDVVWSQTDQGADARSRSTSTSHGGFDSDSDTLTSVAHRILGRAPTIPYPRSRSLGDSLWLPTAQAEAELKAAMAAREGGEMTGTRRALCIGIDAYPSGYALKGCVADARAWQRAFKAAGFTVELLTDKKATRATMIEKITDLVASSKPGDIIALQYSGHGTTLADKDHDEVKAGDLFDEAICPQDFVNGDLIIDDDLGAIWDLLPDGVSFTAFFDSCHSGGAQRALPTRAVARSSLSRYATLSLDTVRKFAAKRGFDSEAIARGSRSATKEKQEPGFFFAACQPEEVAWESGGHGDFTTRAVPLLKAAIAGGETNEELLANILKKFGPNARQKPLVLVPPRLSDHPVLSPVEVGAKGATSGSVESAAAALGSKDVKVAALLRAIADLLDP